MILKQSYTKHLLLFFTLLAFNNFSLAQTVIEEKQENDTNKIFTKVDVEAAFEGGAEAWKRFLRKNLKAGELIDNGAKPGMYKVIVRFIVSKDGSISDVHCTEDPGFGSCEESIRVIKKTPNWVPALINGNKVNAYHSQVFTYAVEKPF
jgi:protein TonB